MKQNLKSRIVFGLISGMIIAIILAFFDYFNDESFSLNKFLFIATGVGLINAVIFSRKRKE